VQVNQAGTVSSSFGVLGRISTYIGVTESQGHGMLHLHALLWLSGAPSTERLEELLQMEVFLDRFHTFLCSNLRASIDGINTMEDLDAVPTHADVAYSQPPNPSSPTYEDGGVTLEHAVACTKQRHK